MPASKDEIRAFLRQFKAAARQNLIFPEPDRQKNLIFLLKQGIAAEERKEILLGLRVEDYIHGPESSDRDPKGPRNVWVFGVEYGETETFVRLRLIEEEKEMYAICISFHEAERPLKFPYRR